MKILVVHGSMRKGKTYKLTKEIMSCLSSKPNVDFTEIHVSDLSLPFCTSCQICFKKGEVYCPNYASYSVVYEALLDCDGVLLSGTTYMWALNAAMKNLLDHLSFNFHRPVLYGKRGMVVATSAGAGEKAVAKYLKTVLGQWGVNGAVVVTRNTKEEALISVEKQTAKVMQSSDKFYQQLISGRNILPSMRSIAVHNAFRSMAQSASATDERDIEFWKQDGYHNKAYPVKAGPKYLLGALVFCLAKQTTKILEKNLQQNSLAK